MGREFQLAEAIQKDIENLKMEDDYIEWKIDELVFLLMAKEETTVKSLEDETIRLLKSSIDEIERVLLGNKNQEVNKIYLHNAVGFIRKAISEDKE